MRKYELVCSFYVHEGRETTGIEATKKILSDNDISLESEEDMGDRDLAYPVKKESRAKFRLFNLSLEPEKLPAVNEALKLQKDILRFLFVAVS